MKTRTYRGYSISNWMISLIYRRKLRENGRAQITLKTISNTIRTITMHQFNNKRHKILFMMMQINGRSRASKMILM